jgi:hypothetical protein
LVEKAGAQRRAKLNEDEIENKPKRVTSAAGGRRFHYLIEKRWNRRHFEKSNAYIRGCRRLDDVS